MLRLDSSEMLPGSQKGEETAQIPSTAIVVVALATRESLAMIAFTKLHITVHTYSVLGCSFKYEDRRRIFRLYHFALILQNNPQYQLGRSVSYGFDRRTTIQPVFFAKSHV